MKVRLFLAGSAAACLVVGHARAGDTTLHVTTNGNGAAVLVQETPTGRVAICNPPCDAKVDPNGEYRFVGAPGSGVRESQAFGLPNGPSFDVDLSTRSQIRYVEGFILLGVGGAAAIAGIVMMVVGNDMNHQSPNSGDVYIGVGSTAGLVAGLITLAWGAGEVARNGHSRITASPSQQPPPATLPPPGVAPPAVPPPASMLWPSPRGLALGLFSIRF